MNIAGAFVGGDETETVDAGWEQDSWRHVTVGML